MSKRRKQDKTQAQNPPGSDGIRLDKWLWAARFFKTRSMATEAVAGGKVQCNGERGKPGKFIKPGDRLTVRKGPYEFTVDVLDLSPRRLPASRAQQLYRETGASLEAREQHRARLRAEKQAHPKPDRRPDKRDRRRLIAAKGRLE